MAKNEQQQRLVPPPTDDILSPDELYYAMCAEKSGKPTPQEVDLIKLGKAIDRLRRYAYIRFYS